jgi:molybdenum cofactor cytidylyltransferase
MISGIVLASGFSRRYGKDKLLQKIDTKTIIETIINHCVNSELDEIVVVYRKEELKQLLEHYQLKMVRNISAEKGMSESMKLGIQHLNINSEACMILMGDQPYFETMHINKMIAVFKREKMITVASGKGIRRTPVIFPSVYYKALLEITGDQGGRMIVDDPLNQKIFIEFDERQLIDIDSEEDLQKLL